MQNIKKNIFLIITVVLNIILYIFLSRNNFNLNFNLVSLIFPIINFLSVSFVLLSIIIRIRENIESKKSFDYLFYSFLFVFFLTINTIINGNQNIEFYAYNLTSSLEYIQNLLNLKINLWSDSRSLGMPMPIIPSFHYNPLLYLGFFFNLKIFYLFLFISHSFFGIIYTIKLSQLFIRNYYLNIFNGFLFAFSAPMINYMIGDDWTASFVSYSLLPLLIYILFKFILAEHRFTFFYITVCSLFLSYYYYNGNPSFHIFLFFISIIFIILCFIYKIKLNNYYNFFITFIITLILIFPNLLHIFQELSKFKYDFQIFNTNKYIAIHWFRLVDNLFPFVSVDRLMIQFVFFEKIFNQNYLDGIKILLTNTLNHGQRSYFLGFFYFCFSIISIFYLFRNLKNIKFLRILFVILILSLVLMHFKSFYFFYLIDENYYGILFIFIGIILSTFFLDNVNLKYKNLITVIIFLQAFQTLTYASLGVFILKNGQQNKIFSTNFFKYDINNSLYDWIDSFELQINEKIILSPEIEKDLNKEYAVYKKYNLFSIQDFYLKKKVRIMNDSFLKGISYDKFLISRSKKNGNFDLNKEIFSNKDNLDILGADIFIIKEEEINEYQFINSLNLISSFELDKLEINTSNDKIIQDKNNRNIYHKFNNFLHPKKNKIKEKWYAFRNNDSHGDLFSISYPYNEEENYFIFNKKCFDISFLCQNNTNLKYNKINFNYSLSGNDGNYRVKFDKTKKKIIIVLNKIYRNNWKAKHRNKYLKIIPINNSLVGIEIPKGVNEISIVYENRIIKFSIVVSIIAMIILIISLPFSYYSINKRLYKSD